MPQVSTYDVLSKTGKAVINGDGFDVCCDPQDRTATLIGEYAEEQICIRDQKASFCEDQDGLLITTNTDDEVVTIQCFRLEPLSMGDL
jgi:hypothetical protein